MEVPERSSKFLSPLQEQRLQFSPELPPAFRGAYAAKTVPSPPPSNEFASIARLFPHTSKEQSIEFAPMQGAASHGPPLMIGVVLSGGPAPGGHNVISGIFDFLAARHPHSRLIGFERGPAGILKRKYKVIDEGLLRLYRNQGGFDLIQTGRDKIESDADKRKALETCQMLSLDGLIVIGGDDSNTNACVLGEYFKAQQCSTKVIGVPKTIDGDLKNDRIESSFGFDTATKTYASLISAIQNDARSSGKYYHFVRVMGRAASNIALECALQTHPNMCLLGEEVKAKKRTLFSIVQELADVVCARAAKGRNYGVFVVPEGLIEFLPQMSVLISELNDLMAQDVFETPSDIMPRLTSQSKDLLHFLPVAIQRQLMLDRDPHGNVQVSKIETERLLYILVNSEIKRRHKDGSFSGSFNGVCHFFGYEGRCCLPSNFDSHYCASLGHTAAALVAAGATGLIATVRNLSKPTKEWVAGGAPLTTMMTLEKRKGKMKPVIKKALVDLDGEPFRSFERQRAEWATEDCYVNVGPIQYNECTRTRGLCEDPAHSITHTLRLEQEVQLRARL